MPSHLSEVAALPQVRLWHEFESSVALDCASGQPYLDVDAYVEFSHDSGLVVRRPAFWDGGSVWRVRFAPSRTGAWSWRWQGEGPTRMSQQDTGQLLAVDTGAVNHAFYDHGFWKMSPGGRNVVHADGTPALVVADTAWGMPWRATPEQATHYARDRSRKGFNAALLMSVQPDMRAIGPRERDTDQGFDVGFEDLSAGSLAELNVGYFQRLDQLSEILVRSQIVPIMQPVFQGFGWKGLDVAGAVVPPAQYARYCRYLVARYGARPVIYLVGADGSGDEPQVAAGGVEVERWDCYHQPTGIHYRPDGLNRAHQADAWLDFQWCQTGHEGEHMPERVADMWRNLPIKGVANGEPTYEHSGHRGRAEGWWQGHEAWSNLCAGGTMGVFYGAGSLWQWRLHRDEPGHEPYFLAPGAGWREALDFEGSQYVGLVRQILAGLDITDMQPDWCSAVAARGLRLRDGSLVVYREHGGDLRIRDASVPLRFRVVDPRTGQTVSSGTRPQHPEAAVTDPGDSPRIYLFSHE